MDPLTPPDHGSALSQALLAVGERPDDARMTAVYDALLTAVLLAPLEPEASSAAKAVLLVERTARGLELPAFSSSQAFAAWGAVPAHLAVRAPELFQVALLRGVDSVQLDPAGPVKVTLGSWEVRRIASSRAPAVQGSPDRDRRSALGLPDPPLPARFVEALTAALERDPSVTEAAVFEADPVRGRRHLVVALRSPEPPEIEPVHDAIAALVPDRALLNFARLGDGEPFASLQPQATVYRS